MANSIMFISPSLMSSLHVPAKNTSKRMLLSNYYIKVFCRTPSFFAIPNVGMLWFVKVCSVQVGSQLISIEPTPIWISPSSYLGGDLE